MAIITSIKTSIYLFFLLFLCINRTLQNNVTNQKNVKRYRKITFSFRAVSQKHYFYKTYININYQNNITNF